jgi:hypothetical protein
MSGEVAWIEDTSSGYALALQDGELVCKNAKGQILKSVPSKAKNSEVAQELLALKEWLGEHEAHCLATIDGWMMRSLPIALGVLVAVWEDPAWRGQLENAIVAPRIGAPSEESGFLKSVDAKKGLGVVNLDGESVWLATDSVILPHPTLLEDLSDWRELAIELEISQKLSQLYRETFKKSASLSPDARSISDYAGGSFEMLYHALGRAGKLNYAVKGGYATTQLWEDGGKVEARYWIGADNPEYETTTGDLVWVDAKERTLRVVDVGPVAYSEGVRMASAIWAGRKVEEEKKDEA